MTVVYPGSDAWLEVQPDVVLPDPDPAWVELEPGVVYPGADGWTEVQS